MGMIDGDWRHREVIIIHPDDDYIFYVDEDIPTFLSNTHLIISIIPKTSQISPTIPNNPQQIPKNPQQSPTNPQKKPRKSPKKKPTVTKKTYGYGSKPIHIFKGE